MGRRAPCRHVVLHAQPQRQERRHPFQSPPLDILSGGGSTYRSRKRTCHDKFLMSPTGAGIRAITVQCWYKLLSVRDNGHCASCGVVPQRKASPFRWRWSIMLISVFITLADSRILLRSDLSDTNDFSDLHGAVRADAMIVSFCFGAMIFRKNLRSKAVDLCLVLLSMACLWIGGRKSEENK